MNSLALLLCVLWPAVTAVAMLPRQTRPLARILAPWAALPALVAGLLPPGRLDTGWLMLGGRLELDALAAVLLPATAGLWLAAGLVAWRQLPAAGRRDGFFGWFLATMTGNVLLLVAQDAILFYLGFALMSFASYGLIVHEKTRRAWHAGRYYIVMVMVGEVCIVAALMLLASSGNTDFDALQATLAEDRLGRSGLIMSLLILGFGIKAGLFGLHFWLPLAHPVAPAPASAVLSGAMIKAGLVAWLRLFPLGDVALPGWGAVLAALGAFTAFYGVLAGLPQREAKTVLAYSSVSQMGLMTLAIGLGLAWPGQWPLLSASLMLLMVHHCLTKGVLFLGAGLVHERLPPVTARVAAVVLALAALALAGGPLSGGQLAKLALKHAVEDVTGGWYQALPMLLSLSSVFTALLLLRFLYLAWPRSDQRTRPLPGLVLMPWLGLFLASLAGPWILAGADIGGKAMGFAAVASAAWPPALAAIITAFTLYLRNQGRLPGLPRVAPGDLSILLEQGITSGGRAFVSWSGERAPAWQRRLADIKTGTAGLGRAMAAQAARGEARLAAWSLTGFFVVLLAVSLAWMMGRG
jgi:formate hydrogenlyase subunit 3/multisubunit Na+/H+ antiporter MnhD subunit